MESRIITLKKNQVQGLLDHLYKDDILSTEDYDHCASSQTTVEKCVTLLKVLKDKDGGLEALYASVSASDVQDQDQDQEGEASPRGGVRGILFLDVMDIHQEYVGIVSEKGTSISQITEEAEGVKKKMDVKHEELPKIPEYNQETEEVKKETNVEPKELPKISEYNQNTTKGEQRMEVNELQNLYPDMAKVFDCPLQFVELTENGASRTVPVYCLRMMFDEVRINTHFCQISYGGCFLINRPTVQHSNDPERFKNYQGSVGSFPIIIPIPISFDNPPPLQYWESDTVVDMNGKLNRSYTLFEMGVCEERWVDRRKWAHNERRSWCIRVGVCPKHSLGICCQIYGDQKQEGTCRSRVRFRTRGKCGKSAELCYGIVIDVGKGRIAFLDVDQRCVLHTFTVAFRETLLPVFAVEPLETCSVKMDVKSGVDNMRKISLIQEALQ